MLNAFPYLESMKGIGIKNIAKNTRCDPANCDSKLLYSCVPKRGNTQASIFRAKHAPVSALAA